MATKTQIIIGAILAVFALLQFVASQGHSSVHLSNGLGYKYNYGIVHGHHGSHHGSSYPHAYGGYGGPGYHIGGGYYNHV
ncbi:cold and drought-regulated protein CORA-like [Cryptotermes secundus]|uniref:cold and drought-regulated protein CORA-like n=1 Tax=Cryptotermes secundus TaxID=105785 RepID=UPI001454BE55|nr:cold and drought-regulated protein CORA-like [Cryptotermes secundus]